MSQLFTQASLGGVKLDNRIIIAPMCQYSAENGKATAWHRIHLGNLALSGAGLMILEAAAVEPEGRITPFDLGIWNDETEAALADVLKDVRAYSPMPLGIQLGHAGRKASTAAPWEGGQHLAEHEGGWQTSAPSAIPFHENDPQPTALTVERINEIKNAFVEAAKRADRLGLDLIEIHAAHGYLLHQFLSPLSNQRSDEYGGSLENRMRLTLEIFREVRKVFPASKPVGVRISATDWVEGGWEIEQSKKLSQALAAEGCAYIHVSSGGLHPAQKISVGPGYQVSFAKAIKAVVDIPVIAVGLITEPEQAEDILVKGEADMIALARGVLYDPRWPWHAAAKLGAKVYAPNQYLRCEPHEVKGLFKQ